MSSIRLFLCLCLVVFAPLVRAAEPSNAQVRVLKFLPEEPIARAQRPATVSAVMENSGDKAVSVQTILVLPSGVRCVGGSARATVTINSGEEKKLVWKIESAQVGQFELQLQVTPKGSVAATTALPMRFLEPVKAKKLAYIPEPEPVQTQVLVGAHNCPLWEADKFQMWNNLLKHPERTPALGFYAQENPEVADWETKWAAEHGVSFFIYCWYRASQGEPVKMRFGSAIHDSLHKSKFVGKMKYTIMWENQGRGTSGVADEKDLMTNLMPFWMENYFKHPSYLKVDNKPVLFIYRPEYLIKDLGGIENVQKAFEKMRQACRDAGFAGLYLLGEYRGLDVKHLQLLKQLGLDYTFAYCWGIANNPTPEQAVQKQMEYIRTTQELHVLPQVVTVSQAWSGWRDEGSIWKIPPADFEKLLRQAKDFIATFPSAELGHKMLLLDNWNEWGEGHYIAPYREYGFGYLDAVRKVFSDAPAAHTDLIPEDIGMGPYDKPYKTHAKQQEVAKKLLSKKVTKSKTSEEGLVGWWAFDEDSKSPVSFDYSGNRMGGEVHDAPRAKGVSGNALVCKGGCVTIPSNPLLLPETAMTIECWLKKDTAPEMKGPGEWFVNRVFNGGTSGFRLGIVQGKPCFQLPKTTWSHNLVAKESLSLGRWIHIAGTFDGKIMRLYVDGVERGSMERPGKMKPDQFELCLGNFALAHDAHLNGLLDEVKLYSRALSAEEVRSHCEKK